MRLLITGYPGWLTARFLETLLDYSDSFQAIRCLSQRGVVSDLKKYSDFVEHVEGDLNDAASLEAAAEGVDVVLHAAGVIHVKRIPDFYEINREGTRRLLEACVKKNVRRLVFISTNAAQGFCPDKTHRLTENDICRPESHYGKSKLQAEDVVRIFQNSGKIETVILRPAMFYGPPVPPRHLEIFRRIKKGTFPVFGSGDYARSITYIDNLVQAIHLAIAKREADGQTYAITDNEIPTLLDIVNTIARCMGCEVKIVHYPVWMAEGARILDEMISVLGFYWMLPHIVGEAHKHIGYSIEKARKELGYHPQVNYREGYARTIQWCQERKLI